MDKSKNSKKQTEADKNAKVVTAIFILAILIPLGILAAKFLIDYMNRPSWKKDLDSQSSAQLLESAKAYYLTDPDKYSYLKSTYNIFCQLDPASTKTGAESQDDIICKFSK